MHRFLLRTPPYAVTRDVRWRHRFSLLTLITTLLLIAWGGFVTSISAGLAVPDWPTSFGSLDPFNPWPEWWTLTPVLAEHGHRLLGALVGLFTLVLAFWTWRGDPRRWMRTLGVFALALVIFQGVLGGLRVVLVSLDLAVVHACVAQIFLSILVAMVVFTTPAWLRAGDRYSSSAKLPRLRTLAVLLPAVLFVQIILGALLRHPGTGIDPFLAWLHIAGATVVTVLVMTLFTFILRNFWNHSLLMRGGYSLIGILALQVALGLTAYIVLLDEGGRIQPSNLQVIVNTTHLVVGAIFMGLSVALALWTIRKVEDDEPFPGVPLQDVAPTHSEIPA